MKKLVWFMTMIAMVLSLCGCGGADPVSHTPKPRENETVANTFGVDVHAPEGDMSAVERLEAYLSENGLYRETVKEDISGYGFEGYEHRPVECYVITLTNDDSVYIRVYDTPKTAADEAANYGGSDGSHYGFDGGMMIIDYIAPVHFWLSDNAIIELGTWDDSIALLFGGFLGEQFAGDVITSVPDGEVEVTYTDYNYFGVGFSFDYDADLCPFIFTTSREFLNFTGDMGVMYSVPPSEEMVEYYGDSFFETGTLIVIPLFESSVSDRHVVERVVKDGNTLTVTVTNYDSGDEAEDFCLLFLELDGKLAYHTEIVLNRQEIFGRYPTEEFAGDEIIVDTVRDGDLSRRFSWTDFRFFAFGSDYDKAVTLSPEVITTVGALNDFVSACGDLFSDDFLERYTLDGYDERFFEKNTLIVIPLAESTVSDMHEVLSMTKDGSTLYITTLNRATEAEAEDFCILFVTLKGRLPRNTEIVLERQETYELLLSEE